jgi:hypothetical protein
MGESGAKVYTELAQSAISRGEGNFYRVWLLARKCDATGRGGLSVADLQAYTTSLLSTQALKRILKQGAGEWWTIDNRKRLWLRGLRSITAHLEAELHSHPVIVPLAHFKKLGDFYTACAASMMCGKERTISQATLGRLYGRSVRTMSSYVKSARQRGLITVTPQTAITRLPADAGTYPEMAALGYHITRVDGKAYMAKRLPNRYSSPLETTPFGQVKTIRQSSSITMREHRRLYFTEESKSLHGALAGLNEGQQLFVITGNNEQSDDGLTLWHILERVENKVIVL